MRVNDKMYMLKIPTKTHPDKFTYPVVILSDKKMLLVNSAYPGEFETIRTAFYKEGLDFNKLSHILLTHIGFDNLGCTKDILKILPNVIVMAPKLDNNHIVHIKLNDNDITPHFDNLKVISTPGHTPGHICLYVKDEELLIAGNLLNIELNLLGLTNKGLNFDNETYLDSVKKVSKLPINKVISYHGGMLEGTINAGIKALIC